MTPNQKKGRASGVTSSKGVKEGGIKKKRKRPEMRRKIAKTTSKITKNWLERLQRRRDKKTVFKRRGGESFETHLPADPSDVYREKRDRPGPMRSCKKTGSREKRAWARERASSPLLCGKS